jgi:hypothetical protein
MRLRSDEGPGAVVEEVGRDVRVVPVYNVTVEDFHTYFVGRPEWGFSVWVHNLTLCKAKEALASLKKVPKMDQAKVAQLEAELASLEGKRGKALEAGLKDFQGKLKDLEATYGTTSPHIADWELTGPKGGKIESGTEISGLEVGFRKGTKLTFPEQAWYTHTEGKVIAELAEAGQLQPGRRLTFEGVLPPCRDCQNILEWASKQYQMEILYWDGNGQLWVWKNGTLVLKP